jgi:hypothetical protein
MSKQPNGTPGKTPPGPSVKVRRGDYRTLVEILKGRKLRRIDDAETVGVTSPFRYIAAGKAPLKSCLRTATASVGGCLRTSCVLRLRQCSGE